MPSPAFVFVLFFVVFHVGSSIEDVNTNDSGNDISANIARSREKRVAGVIDYGIFLASRAAKTLQSLLLRTKTTRPGSLYSRQFQRLGSYDQALKDFDAFRFSEIQAFEHPGGVEEKIGKAGDVIVWVSNKDEFGKPFMNIYYYTPVARVDTIHYLKEH